jgi:hypothetical protein
MKDNYLNINRKYWDLVPGRTPEFVRKRIECLVKSGFLRMAGTSATRISYLVIGSSDEYDRGGELLLEEMQ